MSLCLWLYAYWLYFTSCLRWGNRGPLEMAWMIPFFQSYGLDPEIRWTEHVSQFGDHLHWEKWFSVKGYGRYAKVEDLDWNCQLTYGETNDFVIRPFAPNGKRWESFSTAFTPRRVRPVCEFLMGGEWPDRP